MQEPSLTVKGITEKDPLLKPYSKEIKKTLECYMAKRKELVGDSTISDFANGYMYFGFQRKGDAYVFREWLPMAEAVWIMGDFNSWNRTSHPLKNIGNGVYEIEFSQNDGIKSGQYVKLLVLSDGKLLERTPAYIRRAVLDKDTAKLCGMIWDGEFTWTDDEWMRSEKVSEPLVYEAHVGMATEEYREGSYIEFADRILPRISRAGYNTLQLMAVMEHPYYASFGYQVTNFFAPSYRFGTPEELKYLINKAHNMGIAVILDVVHSHACPNIGEGLNLQDGSDFQYFHEGGRGWHSAWGTRCFDYGKNEVIYFLLSNLKYWQSEFHFDGFRFDGVTSMLYKNHALGVAFTDYSYYYSDNTDVDAIVYLMLANELVHEVDPRAVTVAEDMSGLPGMCLPRSEGGCGFDYRLAMGVPDMWIRLIKELPIEHWDLGHVFYELTNGRADEKSIGYAESHDQALVGDKTIIFRLADSEMYTGMNKDYHSPRVDTAIDMHKLIRFLTATLSGGGYLNFMGNEFGHPEWIDFPREGNGWSYHYARRQWSLFDSTEYKYEWLGEFDRALIGFIKDKSLLCTPRPISASVDNTKKLIVYKRAGFIFAVNMHPTASYEDVFIDCPEKEKYGVILSSDDFAYGGQNRIAHDYVYVSERKGSASGFKLYLPARCAVVLACER